MLRRSSRVSAPSGRQATSSSVRLAQAGNATLVAAGRLAGASMRALSEKACALIRGQPRDGAWVFPSRSGGQMIGYRKMWLKIAATGKLAPDITPHVLRHSFASLAADLGYGESTIAALIGHKTHSITSRYLHSADAVLVAAADAVAAEICRLMGSPVIGWMSVQLAQPAEDPMWDELTFL